MPFTTETIETIRDPLPETVIETFVPITHLGDPLFFIILAAVVYWLGDHDRGALFIGAMLLVLGLTVGLKELFGLPRPPVEFHLVTDGGYGLPSGHTSGAILVYGALAALYDVGPRRLRYAAAVVVAGLVALSRLILGVHYLADVLAGAVLGIGVLLIVLRFRDRSPAVFYGAAAAAALVGVALSRLTYDSALLLFGGAAAAVCCWPFLQPLPDPPRRVTAAVGAVALPVVVGLAYVGISVLDAPLALLASTAAAMALVLVTPHVADRLARTVGA